MHSSMSRTSGQIPFSTSLGPRARGLAFKHALLILLTQHFSTWRSQCYFYFLHVQTPYKPLFHLGAGPGTWKSDFMLLLRGHGFCFIHHVLTLKTKKRKGNPRRRDREKERGSWGPWPGAAHLFPLLSRSIALPITLDFISSSCTSSSSVFLQVCLALCPRKRQERHDMWTQPWQQAAPPWALSDVLWPGLGLRDTVEHAPALCLARAPPLQPGKSANDPLRALLAATEQADTLQVQTEAQSSCRVTDLPRKLSTAGPKDPEGVLILTQVDICGFFGLCPDCKVKSPGETVFSLLLG